MAHSSSVTLADWPVGSKCSPCHSVSAARLPSLSSILSLHLCLITVQFQAHLSPKPQPRPAASASLGRLLGMCTPLYSQADSIRKSRNRILRVEAGESGPSVNIGEVPLCPMVACYGEQHGDVSGVRGDCGNSHRIGGGGETD